MARGARAVGTLFVLLLRWQRGAASLCTASFSCVTPLHSLASLPPSTSTRMEAPDRKRKICPRHLTGHTTPSRPTAPFSRIAPPMLPRLISPRPGRHAGKLRTLLGGPAAPTGGPPILHPHRMCAVWRWLLWTTVPAVESVRPEMAEDQALHGSVCCIFCPGWIPSALPWIRRRPCRSVSTLHVLAASAEPRLLALVFDASLLVLESKLLYPEQDCALQM